MALWVESTGSTHDESSKRLVALLAKILVMKEQIFDELGSIAAIDLSEIEQPDNFKARTFWTAAVLEVRRQARLRDLIEHMAERFPARKADFEQFLTLEISTGPVAAVQGLVAGPMVTDDWRTFEDPLAACFVGPGLSSPIFDRENLRSDLRRLREQGYRSLNITGEPRTGKSFSLQLVQLVCEADDSPIVVVDVEDWGTDAFTDVDLVQTLAAQLRANVDVEAVRNVPDPHTRARLLLYAFRDAVEPPEGKPRWIVIDGLDRPNVHPTAKAFVERLLKSIEKDNKPSDTRLVVTGFDGILPTSSRRDSTEPITSAHVDNLLALVVDGHAPPVTDAQRTDWVAQAMAALEQSGGDLGALAGEIFRLVSEHFETGGGGG
jgi:hypothetical protein